MEKKNTNKNSYQNASSRREFLKILGFGAGVTALFPACEQPVRKMIPYLIQPEEVIPGKASHYATTYRQGNLICPVVVKSRDGRPIKIEGNQLSSVTEGGTNARIQASILDLYNPGRSKNPVFMKNQISWEEADLQIKTRFEELNNKKIAFVSETISSPSEKKLIEKLISRFPNIEHLEIDAISFEAIRLANKACFGMEIIPAYQFQEADIVVGFNCDFLGGWISPVEFSKQYSKRKEPEGNLIRHIQFESTFTITGAAADERFPINPSEEKAFLLSLLTQIERIKTGQKYIHNIDYEIDRIASELFQHKTRSLVVSGSNIEEIQILVNAINWELGNIGSTIDFSKPYLTFKGKGLNIERLTEGITTKSFAGAIFYQFDPLFFLENPQLSQQHIQDLGLSVFMGTMPPESEHIYTYILPVNHFLESWSDSEIKQDFYSLGQPLTHPLFSSRQREDILLKWMDEDVLFNDYLKDFWETEIFPLASTNLEFPDFWDETLQKGIFELQKETNIDKINWDEKSLALALHKKNEFAGSSVEIQLFESSVFGEGNQISNPWLLELPDPVTKQCWGNAALISLKLAEKLELSNGQTIKISVNNKQIKLPVIVLPGQANNTVSIALGFGKQNSMLNDNGVNVFHLAEIKNGLQQYSLEGKISKTGNFTPIALGQLHNSQEGRNLIRKKLESESLSNQNNQEHKNREDSFYEPAEFPGYHWGLAVDLNKCTGCGTCIIACQSENNIAVVGKPEVIRKHEMHWLRIDRYFEGNEENPEMLVQPVMCQHCDYAPCENVCPVSATSHSVEGVNQMVYNRCIGTRYCANNCPYKVRRFNWFDYAKTDVYKNNEVVVDGMDSDMVRMALNPDVTVRSKGVIEKCSFCIQRIVEIKNKAKLENRAICDGEIKMACEQSCPSGALVFGDMNNPESRVSKLIQNDRSYQLLEEISTSPSVTYLRKTINNNKLNA